MLNLETLIKWSRFLELKPEFWAGIHSVRWSRISEKKTCNSSGISSISNPFLPVTESTSQVQRPWLWLKANRNDLVSGWQNPGYFYHANKMEKKTSMKLDTSQRSWADDLFPTWFLLNCWWIESNPAVGSFQSIGWLVGISKIFLPYHINYAACLSINGLFQLFE